MATAILIGSMCIAGAINPDWLMADNGDYEAVGWVFVAFIIYDLISLQRPR